jgi:hypothetical protein
VVASFPLVAGVTGSESPPAAIATLPLVATLPPLPSEPGASRGLELMLKEIDADVAKLTELQLVDQLALRAKCDEVR